MDFISLDPIENQFPKRASTLTTERVLHVHLGTPDDPQAGLVRALTALGSAGYWQINWYAHPRDTLQQAILAATSALKPTLVFMQLQTPGIVDVATVHEIRRISPGVVIATWCGDIANNNSPWNVGWQVPLGQAVDLTLHTSMTHVDALRAAGVASAAYLQIGYDRDQYHSNGPASQRPVDVTFLGNRYYSDQYLSTMRQHDAGLRDEVISVMARAFGESFRLYGGGFGPQTSALPLNRAHEGYHNAKIGLNISLCNFFPAYQSDRIFRILGCGSLLLTKRFPLMSSYGLVDGTNCLVWDTAADAVAGARHALSSRPDCLDSIAAAGAQLAEANHTWEVRMRELIPLIEHVRGTRQ